MTILNKTIQESQNALTSFTKVINLPCLPKASGDLHSGLIHLVNEAK